jgi:hypothetical protein
MALAQVNSKEQLLKVLAIQAAITERARKEMLAAGTSSLTGEKKARGYVAAERELLEKYARYPTLTEFSKMPNTMNSVKWGATFGVAALVGALILDFCKTFLELEGDPREALMIFLMQLDDPKVKAVEMDRVTKVLAQLTEHFGITWTKDKQIQLTVTGRRVVLHMMDAHIFAKEIGEAQAQFREEKPAES